MSIDMKEVNRLSEPRAARYAETGSPTGDGQRLADLVFNTAGALNASYARFLRHGDVDPAQCCIPGQECREHLIEKETR